MDILLRIFSTRELAIFFWIIIGIFIAIFNEQLRNGIFDVLKTIFGKKIESALFSLTVYVAILVYTLYKLELWNLSMLKDTVFWYFVTALILFFTINKIKTLSDFKNIARQNFKWTMILEFVVNFYTFSLLKEILILPMATLATFLLIYSETDDKYIKVTSFLRNVLAIAGIMLIIYVGYKTFKNYKELFTIHNLFSLLQPPILTLLLLPFLYFVALFIHYEELFVRIRFITTDSVKRKNLKRQILLKANFNLNGLNNINQNLNKAELIKAKNIGEYIKCCRANSNRIL